MILTITDNGRVSRKYPELGTRGFTEGKVGGSGLASAPQRENRGLVRSIAVQSKVGGGTTITIELPQAKPPAWFHTHLRFMKVRKSSSLMMTAPYIRVWQARFEPLLKSISSKCFLSIS